MKKKRNTYDFSRRARNPSGFPYSVTKDGRTIARTQSKRVAALLCWALAAETILLDIRVLSFVVAIKSYCQIKGLTIDEALKQSVKKRK